MLVVPPLSAAFLFLACLALLSSSGVRCHQPHYKSRAYQQQEEHEVNKLVSQPASTTRPHTARRTGTDKTALHCTALRSLACQSVS